MKLKIQAKRAGFRRAGFTFSDQEPTYLDKNNLTKAQIEQLTSDASLVVLEVDDKEGNSKGKGSDEQTQKDLAAAQEKVESLKAEVKQLQGDLKASQEAHAKTQKELDKVQADLAKATKK